MSPKTLSPFAPAAKCPKCGFDEVRVAYCDGHSLRYYKSACYKTFDSWRDEKAPEHLHRTCQRCRYEWLEECCEEGK